MAERTRTYSPRGNGRTTTGTPTTSASGLRQKFAGNAWHPTVINLVVLLIVEIGVYALLRYSFRQFHGG